MRLSFLALAFVTAAFGQIAWEEELTGNINGGGGPIAKSTMTLWANGEEERP